MSTSLKYSIAFLIVAASVSCTVKEEQETSSIIKHRYELSFDTQSKTTFTQEGSQYHMSFEKNDVICYSSGPSSIGAKTATVGLENDSAVIEMETSVGDRYIAAIYGSEDYSNVQFGQNAITSSTAVKSIQHNTQFSGAHVCVAFSDDLGASTLHFQNVASVLKFSSCPNLAKLVIRGNNNEVICGGADGVLSITDTSGNISVAPASDQGNSGNNSITIDNCSGNDDFYIAMLPVSFEGGFSIDCYTADNPGQVAFTMNYDKPFNAASASGKPKVVNLGNASSWIASHVVVPVEVVRSLTVRDFQNYKVAYSCEEDVLYTAWMEMPSYLIEDEFGDVETFKSNYTPDWNSGDVMKTYTLKSGRTGNNLSDFSADYCQGDNSNYKYGTIHYYPEGSTDYYGANFVISINKAQKDYLRDLPGKTQTLYAKFTYVHGNVTEHLFLGFRIYLMSDTSVRFVEHNPVYWYNDITGYSMSTIRMAVEVPMVWKRGGSPMNSDVTEFKHNLSDDWLGGVVKMQNVSPWTPTAIEWTFSQSNTRIKIPDPDRPGSYKSWRINNSPDGEYLSYGNNPTPVVYLDKNTGLVRYAHGDSPDHISNKLLNQFARSEQSADKMLYCEVCLSGYLIGSNGICRILAGQENMYVRFLRPISFLPSSDITLLDGTPGVSYKNLGSLFSAYDWNTSVYSTGFPLFSFDPDTQSTSPCYYPDDGDDVEWYGYYGVNRISLDIENTMAEVSYYSTPKKLSDLSPGAKIWLARKSDRYTLLDATSIDISTADKIGDYVIVYSNPAGGLKGGTLTIPVSVEYAWGRETFNIKITLN